MCFPLPYLGDTDPLKAAGLPVGASGGLLSAPESPGLLAATPSGTLLPAGPSAV